MQRVHQPIIPIPTVKMNEISALCRHLRLVLTEMSLFPVVKSRLSTKLLLIIIPVICVLAIALYEFTVPFIKRSVFELEEDAGRAVLNTAFELANRIYLNLEREREMTLESYQARLKDIVDITQGYNSTLGDAVRRGEITEADARQTLFATLRRFRYGNRNSVWIADYDSNFLSHPDPLRYGHSAISELDENNLPIMPKVIALARKNHEGFITYRWHHEGNSQSFSRLAYFRDFPEWGFVAGTGVFLEEVEKDVQKRKAAAVENLREALRDVKIGRTGYLYIFDSKYRMLIHPNPNIEETYVGELVDPTTRRAMGPGLEKIADTDQGRFYKWDRPEDPGNYIYDKVAWVRHFKGFDWYIASSAYLSELKESSQLLGDRILSILVVFLALSLLLSILFIRHITGPITHLAKTARRIQKGDLSARSGLRGSDELATLSNAFDGMIVRLRDNIHNLDATVRERTSELEDSNRQLTKTVEALQCVRRDLAQADLRQRIILDAIPACVAQINERHRILFVNQRYADLFGLPKKTLIGQSLAMLSQWESKPDIMLAVEAARTGKAITFVCSWCGPSGRQMILKTSLMPSGAGEAESSLFVLALDVTEEKEAEKRMLEMQRLGAVAQLSAGLTHDFNNLLSIILGNLSCLQDRHLAPAAMDEYLVPAIRAVHRGAGIMDRLLAFARSQPLEPAPVDVSKLLQSVVILLRGSLPRCIGVEFQELGAHWAFADAAQLENAIINLALNARDAMPNGGRLGLAVGYSSSHELSPGTSGTENPLAQDFVEIKVSDTGHGFSSLARARAFEPFFTTKKNGKGSGLGLSMVFGFVSQSGGHVDIETTEGTGTTVTILLPVASEEQQSVSDVCSERPSSTPWTGKLALVVEDETEVREIVRRELVEFGFSVMECADADEAVQLIHYVDDLFLIVTDIVMPGMMNGLEFAEQVIILKHQARIVMMTGFVSDEDLAPHVSRSWTILRKPFDKYALYAAITRAARTTAAASG